MCIFGVYPRPAFPKNPSRVLQLHRAVALLLLLGKGPINKGEIALVGPFVLHFVPPFVPHFVGLPLILLPQVYLQKQVSIAMPNTDGEESIGTL